MPQTLLETFYSEFIQNKEITNQDNIFQHLYTSPTEGIMQHPTLEDRRKQYGENVLINTHPNLPRFVVRRNGQDLDVESEEIVTGDLVNLSQDNFVTFDGIIVTVDECYCDESDMTGEPELAHLKKGHRVMSGTTIKNGSCWAIAVFVGAHCEHGKTMYNYNSEEKQEKKMCIVC